MRALGGIREQAFQIVLAAAMLAICFLMLYPIWNITAVSFNEGKDAMLGGIYWWPRTPTLQNYVTVFRNPMLLPRLRGSASCADARGDDAARVLHLHGRLRAVTKRHLIGRNVYLALGTVTLFFGGGTDPLLPAASGTSACGHGSSSTSVPTMFSFYNLIIFQAFFRELPHGARGVRPYRRGGRLQDLLSGSTMPLSMPVLATIALFVGVYNWNDFFYGVIFIKQGRSCCPSRPFLYRIIAEASRGQIEIGDPSSQRGAGPGA